MLRVLGYSADRDCAFTSQDALGFCFNDVAGNVSVSLLVEQLASAIHANTDGLSFGDLFSSTCHLSPADSAKYRQAVKQLAEYRQIEIVDHDGSQRRRASTIKDADRLKTAALRTFHF